MGGGPQNMNAMIRQAQKLQEDMKGCRLPSGRLP